MRIGLLLHVDTFSPVTVRVGFLVMDPDDIAKLVSVMKLSNEKEGNTVNLSADLIHEGKGRQERCLIGKVFSSKAVNRDIFRTHMPRILQAQKQIEIEAAGDNIFIFEFKSPIDRRRALFDGPWHFFKNLVLFQEPSGFQNASEVLFDEFSLWVQLHNLPVAFMHPNILRRLGEQIGKVEEVDVGEGGCYLGRFARIRVTRKLSLPLQKCLWVSTEEATDDIIIILVYEKLPDFCFACGRIGHVLRDCEDVEAPKDNPSFGNWLRASTHSGKKKVQLERDTRPNQTHQTPGGSDSSEKSSIPTNSQSQRNPRGAVNDSPYSGQVQIPRQDEYILELIKESDNVQGHNLRDSAQPSKERNTQRDITSVINGDCMDGQILVSGAGDEISFNTTEMTRDHSLSLSKVAAKWKRRAREVGNQLPSANIPTSLLEQNAKTGSLHRGIKRIIEPNCSGDENHKKLRPDSQFVHENSIVLAQTSAAAAEQPRRSS